MYSLFVPRRWNGVRPAAAVAITSVEKSEPQAYSTERAIENADAF